MKQVIDLLRLAHRHLNVEDLLQSTQMDMIADARGYIASAIAALQPRWETPEQREKRTGEKLTDNAAVWVLERDALTDRPLCWTVYNYGDAKFFWLGTPIICATEAEPPPDGWVPEEEAQ